MNPSRVYLGRRRPDGSVLVTEGHRTLPLRLDLRSHNPGGFEWGPGEGGPAQLALALLADQLGDDARTLACYQEFKRRVVQVLPPAGWKLSGQQIDDVVAKIESHAARDHLSDLLGVVRKVACGACGKRRTFWGHDDDAVDGRIQLSDWVASADEEGRPAWKCPSCATHL